MLPLSWSAEPLLNGSRAPLQSSPLLLAMSALALPAKASQSPV